MGSMKLKQLLTQDGNHFEDVARFNKVNEPNASYKAPEEEGGSVSNWFEMPEGVELEDVDVEELTITDDVYSTRSSFDQLLENEETKAIIHKYLVGIEEHPMFGMARTMSINNLAELAPEQFNEKMLYTLNKELTKIKKN